MTALKTQRLNDRTARPIDLTEMGFGGAPLGNPADLMPLMAVNSSRAAKASLPSKKL